MTPDEIKTLAAQVAVTDVATAGRAFGLSRASAYELVARGEFPCTVLRLGRRYLIPVAGILAALGLDQPGDE